MDLLFPRFYAIKFNFSSPLKANKANAMTANYWGDNEPLDVLFFLELCGNPNLVIQRIILFVLVRITYTIIQKLGDRSITCYIYIHKSHIRNLL